MGRSGNQSYAGVPVLRRPDTAEAPVDLPGVLAGHSERLAADGPLLIVVNDPQRDTDTGAVLRALQEISGRRPGDWRILVACGTHRFDAERRAAFEHALTEAAGPFAAVTWHDCRAETMLPVGRHGRWRCNSLLAASDTPVLVVGSVEPHYFAGLTGAHKTVTIGCADRAAIEANHAAAMSPAAQPFALAGNPVYDGVAAMVADVQAIRPVVAVNLLQAGSQILAAAAGEPLAALARLEPAARERFRCSLEAPADALVLEVTGPLAGSFYQADKAIKNSEDAVRDGGVLVLTRPYVSAGLPTRRDAACGSWPSAAGSPKTTAPRSV